MLDSVNQWIANLALNHGGRTSPEQLEDLLSFEIRQLCGAVESSGEGQRLVLVSSEVGAGLSPPSNTARAFRQATGRANAYLSRLCSTVVLVSSGLPLVLKG